MHGIFDDGIVIREYLEEVERVGSFVEVDSLYT